jgi:hypothetical protein
MVLGIDGDEPNALERGRLHRELIEAVQLSGIWTVGDSSDMPTDEVALVMGCAAPSPSTRGSTSSTSARSSRRASVAAPRSPERPPA